MGQDLASISNMQEVFDTVRIFSAFMLSEKTRPIPILSNFKFLPPFEIEEKLTNMDISDFGSKIPMEAKINKRCKNCKGPYKTRFNEVDFCTLKCKREWELAFG